MPRSSRQSPEGQDAIGKDQGQGASDVCPGSRQGPVDSTERAERAAAYRAVVDAAYRQDDIDHGSTRPEEPDPEAVARVTRHADGDGRGSRMTVGGEATPVRDHDSPYCPVSELKGDEPATAERLLKAQAFTGETLRGFNDTDNPDFIDSYNRTYDAVGGPTAWANPLLNMTRMLSQIHRHIYEKDGVDFTVLDLTGASSTQIGEVFDNIDKWAADPAVPAKSRIIILGDDY
jgi:hypothetical protein